MNMDHRKGPLFSVGGVGILVVCAALLALHARASTAAAGAGTASAAVAGATSLPGTVDLSCEALANIGLHFAKAELRPGVRPIEATGIVNFNARRLAQLSSPSRGRIVAIDVAGLATIPACQPIEPMAPREFDHEPTGPFVAGLADSLLNFTGSAGVGRRREAQTAGNFGVTLADLSTVRVQANVSERDASAVRPGMAVTQHVDAYPDRQIQRMRSQSGYAHRSSRTRREQRAVGRRGHGLQTIGIRQFAANSNRARIDIGLRRHIDDMSHGALRANMFASVGIQLPLGRDTGETESAL